MDDERILTDAEKMIEDFIACEREILTDRALSKARIAGADVLLPSHVEAAIYEFVVSDDKYKPSSN